MIRVIKVGGSLLDWPPLPSCLLAWINTQPAATNVLLVGGGRIVDEIRRADRTFHLGEEAAHWLAVAALSLTARLLSAALPDLPLLLTYDELQAAMAGHEQLTLLFDPTQFLYELEPHLPGPALPHDWQATSDSIAARLAQALGAEELVLLKSNDPPAAALPELAAAGFVDQTLSLVVPADCRLTLVNLRRFA